MNNKNKDLPMVVHGFICSYCFHLKDVSFFIINDIQNDYCNDCYNKVKYTKNYHKYKCTKKYKSYIKSYECECGVTLKSGQITNIKKHMRSQKHKDLMNDKAPFDNINLDHLSI